MVLFLKKVAGVKQAAPARSSGVASLRDCHSPAAPYIRNPRAARIHFFESLTARAERVFERGLSRRSVAQADDLMISMMPALGKTFRSFRKMNSIPTAASFKRNFPQRNQPVAPSSFDVRSRLGESVKSTGSVRTLRRLAQREKGFFQSLTDRAV